jgi:hypothetical protein
MGKVELTGELIQSTRAPATARIGAVFSLHHFGSSLNVHLHFHVAIYDGVFYKAGDQLHFGEANVTAVDIAPEFPPDGVFLTHAILVNPGFRKTIVLDN